MPTQPGQQESLDITKIYIWIMGSLCVIVFAWLIFNYFSLSSYERKLQQGFEDLQKIQAWEKERPKKKGKSPPKEIEQIFKLFQRTVQVSEEPEVPENPPWEPGNIGGVLFEEKRYVVRFEKGIPRQEVALYIFKIQEAMPFLKVKRLDLQKAENSPPYEDKWKTEIEFAFRKPKQAN
jgi:hypothetical protein